MLFIQIVELTNDFEGIDDCSENDFSVEIIYGQDIRTTTIKWNTICPVWNEAFIFKYIPGIDKIIFKIIEQSTLFVLEKKVVEIIRCPPVYEIVQINNIKGLTFYMGNLNHQKDKELHELINENEEAATIMCNRKVEIEK